MSEDHSDHEEMKEEPKELNKDSACEICIQTSNLVDGLVHGLNEVIKTIDRKQAQFVLLAEDCQEAKYKKLVSAFCKQNNVPLMDISERKQIGEWVGYYKLDTDGVTKRKIKGVSSLAIKDWGSAEGSEYQKYLLDHAN